ncbi:MAG TPA: hypothetical protein VJB16_00245 [archaeon]|nr:hypothetical protein [archaeon]
MPPAGPMAPDEFQRLRSAFLTAFASVPEPLRKQLIVVVDGAPYNWLAAFAEMEQGTALGQRILLELKRLQVIG